MGAIPKERHELKFIVDTALVPAMRRYLTAYCDHDEYTRAYGQAGYPIASTYYDSPSWAAMRGTLNGDRDRVKLRVRSYVDCWKPLAADVDDSPTFFEIKRKVNGIVMKRRALTTARDAARLMVSRGADLDRLTWARQKDRDVAADFFRIAALDGSLPAIIVRYRREAFESRYHSYVRITFDRDLGGAAPSPNGMPLNLACRNVDVGGTIFEIKFTGTYPRWVGDLIRRFELQRRSVPKYVMCVQTLQARLSYRRERHRLLSRAIA